MSLANHLAERRICICVGAGGVGKTTSAAAIALGLAGQGRRVALITIDPSRRLAGALALDELLEPRRLSAEHLAPTGLRIPGEVWAMVLDPKRTFDELISRIAPDEQTRERVFANHIYREISTAVGGAHEFTAIAKLYELDRSGEFDAIVLDTPPSRNTLDFLRAPDSLLGFFDAPALRVLLTPAGIGARLAKGAGAPALSMLGRLIGADLLGELAQFFAAVGSLIGEFRERAVAVERLLRDRGTTFILVSSPEREPVRESIAFAGELRAGGLEVGGGIVNRVGVRVPGFDAASIERVLAPAVGERLAAVVAESATRAEVQAAHDERNLERLRVALGGVPLSLVPLLDRSLGELATLGEVTRHLFGTQR